MSTVQDLNPYPGTYFAQTSAKLIIPSAESNANDIIHRWSDERVSKPALVVIPSENADVIAAVKYAAASGLKIVVGSGGHKVVPIDEKTLYLDMQKFKIIDVNSNQPSVSIGGGVTNQELLEALHSHGFYTSKKTSTFYKG